MKLKIERRWKKADYTIGILYIDGVRFCETLEDAVRGEKVYGKTAIPAGTYEINMETISPRFRNRAWAKPFGGKLPRLLNVPNYEGVLIHVGNTAEDTSGCILVGNNRAKGMVLDSTICFNQLMREFLIPAHKIGDKITIEIV